MRKKNINLTILGILLICLGIVSNLSEILLPNDNAYNNKEINLKKAGYWEIGSIEIDDNDPSKNWSITAATYDWCSGTGTWNDPYVIENVTIDAQLSNGGILIKNSDVYFIVKNSSVTKSGLDGGIYLEWVNNGIIMNNTLYNNDYAGMYLSRCENITLINNVISENNQTGMHLSVNQNITVVGNKILNNSNLGIYQHGYNTTFKNNVFFNDNLFLSSISVDNFIIDNNFTFPYVSDFTFPSDAREAIEFNGCSNNTVLRNKIDGGGISLGTGSLEALSSHIISSNNLINGKPLYYYTYQNHLDKKNFTNAGQIILVNCNNSFLSSYNISHATRAICLYYSNNNTVDRNNLTLNRIYGILLYNSHNNSLMNNTFNKNFRSIGILNSHEIKICNNSIFKSYQRAINLLYSNNSKIVNNIIKESSSFSIILSGSNEGIISSNDILNNAQGLIIEGGSHNNLIYNNYFKNPGTFNAKDGGSNNQWDNGTMGNYWDDYDGSDADDDGIGDTPYLINGTAGSMDNYPIWWDPPVFSIISPAPNDKLSKNAPYYNISIEEGIVNSTWYTLDGGNNITFTGLTGTINQALWDALPEGNVIIRFYANDTLGRIGFQEVTVVKTISQLGIPGYNILLLLGIVSTITVIIFKKKLNHFN